MILFDPNLSKSALISLIDYALGHGRPGTPGVNPLTLESEGLDLFDFGYAWFGFPNAALTPLRDPRIAKEVVDIAAKMRIESLEGYLKDTHHIRGRVKIQRIDSLSTEPEALSTIRVLTGIRKDDVGRYNLPGFGDEFLELEQMERSVLMAMAMDIARISSFLYTQTTVHIGHGIYSLATDRASARDFWVDAMKGAGHAFDER